MDRAHTLHVTIRVFAKLLFHTDRKKRQSVNEIVQATFKLSLFIAVCM